MLPPELSRLRKAKVDEVVKTGSVVRFEDGHSGTQIYNILYPIFNPSGQVEQFGVYAMDVSADKKTKRELEQTQARLECLLDHSPAALYSRSHTDDCEFLYLSNNILKLTGFSQEEILADPFFWSQRIHPEDRGRFAGTHRAGLLSERQSNEYRFRHQDGAYRWLHDKFNLVQDKQGTPLEYIGSLIDITAAKEAQEKLALSEKRYRAMVECQTDLIDRFTPDTTLIYVNDAICRLFGQSREELLGRSFLPLLPEEAQQRVKTLLDSLTRINRWGKSNIKLSCRTAAHAGRPG